MLRISASLNFGAFLNIFLKGLQHHFTIQIIQENQPCFISNVVLYEVVWVLRGRPYQFGKDEIIATLGMMVQSSGFEARKPFCGLPGITTHQAGTS